MGEEHAGAKSDAAEPQDTPRCRCGMCKQMVSSDAAWEVEVLQVVCAMKEPKAPTSILYKEIHKTPYTMRQSTTRVPLCPACRRQFRCPSRPVELLWSFGVGPSTVYLIVFVLAWVAFGVLRASKGAEFGKSGSWAELWFDLMVHPGLMIAGAALLLCIAVCALTARALCGVQGKGRALCETAGKLTWPEAEDMEGVVEVVEGWVVCGPDGEELTRDAPEYCNPATGRLETFFPWEEEKLNLFG